MYSFTKKSINDSFLRKENERLMKIVDQKTATAEKFKHKFKQMKENMKFMQ